DAGAPQQDARCQAAGPDARPTLFAYREVRSGGARIVVTFASVRRAAIRVAAVLFFMVLAGATYQGVATAFERRQFRHPGRLVDVGGHQLHIYCSGEGSPTVVLEAGGAGMSAAWGWVQPRIAKATRVCSYDRAGLGWSESGDSSYDPE